MLHFAPEKILHPVLKKTAAEHKTADLITEGHSEAYGAIDYKIDISDMTMFTERVYDCFIVCAVPEHVYNDKKATSEIYRVLSHKGYCFLTVPQQDGLSETYEDLSITGSKEREKKFGKYDHVRIYGSDFPEFLRKADFTMYEIDELNFPEESRRRNVLFPYRPSERPLATNHRKVFVEYKA